MAKAEDELPDFEEELDLPAAQPDDGQTPSEEKDDIPDFAEPDISGTQSPGEEAASPGEESAAETEPSAEAAEEPDTRDETELEPKAEEGEEPETEREEEEPRAEGDQAEAEEKDQAEAEEEEEVEAEQEKLPAKVNPVAYPTLYVAACFLIVTGVGAAGYLSYVLYQATQGDVLLTIKIIMGLGILESIVVAVIGFVIWRAIIKDRGEKVLGTLKETGLYGILLGLAFLALHTAVLCLLFELWLYNFDVGAEKAWQSAYLAPAAESAPAKTTQAA